MKIRFHHSVTDIRSMRWKCSLKWMHWKEVKWNYWGRRSERWNSNHWRMWGESAERIWRVSLSGATCYLKRRWRSGWRTAPSAGGRPERQSPTGRAVRGRDLSTRPIEPRPEPRRRPKHHNPELETPPRRPPSPQLLRGGGSHEHSF